MTWKETCKQISGTTVIQSTRTSREFQVDPTPEGTFIVQNLDNGKAYEVTEDEVGYGDYEIADWIEEGKAITPSCTCDFYNQLMPFGCNCGGT